jgi:hypothetical protein
MVELVGIALMNRLRGILISCFAIGGLLTLVWFNLNRPRILVLHSGSERSLWVSDVNRGLEQQLERNRRPINLERHYLRLDEPGLSPETVRLRVQDAQRAVARLRPDILIAVDDEANALVAQDYLGLTTPKLLYVSIDQPPEEYGYRDSDQVTGISEELPLAAVRKALDDLQPALQSKADSQTNPGSTDQGRASILFPTQLLCPERSLRIAALARDSETGRAELAQVQQFDWAPHRLGPVKAVSTLVHWQEETKRLVGAADVLLVLSYRGLQRNADSEDWVPGSELAQWLEAESVPLPIGLNVGYVVDGGGLSLAPAPTSYGMSAMEMALEWLEPARQGKLPKSRRSPHFDIALRAGRLQQRGLSLPIIYSEAARAGNDLYER